MSLAVHIVQELYICSSHMHGCIHLWKFRYYEGIIRVGYGTKLEMLDECIRFNSAAVPSKSLSDWYRRLFTIRHENSSAEDLCPINIKIPIQANWTNRTESSSACGVQGFFIGVSLSVKNAATVICLLKHYTAENRLNQRSDSELMISRWVSILTIDCKVSRHYWMNNISSIW